MEEKCRMSSTYLDDMIGFTRRASFGSFSG